MQSIVSSEVLRFLEVSKMKLDRVGYIGILMVGLFVLGGCTSQAQQATGDAAMASGPVKEFVMESFTEVVDGKYFPQFSPGEIRVEQGDTVRIKVTNIKGTHDFKIDEFDVHAQTPLNEEVVVEFVADKAGTFEYYCTMPGHRQNGHWGKLIVEG
jgi:plastocyanin